ncbi:hypothetical protein BSU04_31235 [Caballeronia sordidicola]|uniref:Uncharacterized protein n=1 Tax=Caballeronia sordidicola TaxID=196367 RepID=A0A226WUL9_CABSO|nr:hypothetical protein BSU04_31235 [Caballeronia sordidicola]
MVQGPELGAGRPVTQISFRLSSPDRQGAQNLSRFEINYGDRALVMAGDQRETKRAGA